MVITLLRLHGALGGEGQEEGEEGEEGETVFEGLAWKGHVPCGYTIHSELAADVPAEWLQAPQFPELVVFLRISVWSTVAPGTPATVQPAAPGSGPKSPTVSST